MKLIGFVLISCLLFSCSDEKSSEESGDSASSEKTDQLIVKDTTVTVVEDEVVLNFALLSTETDDHGLDSLIYDRASLYAVTHSDIEQTREEWETMGNGLIATSYQVNYNKNGIFDISYDLEYLGAHLSYDYQNICLDLHAKRPVELLALLGDNEVEPFLEACNEKLKVNLEEGFADIPEEDSEEMKEYYEGHEVTIETLAEFSISEDGIIVYYDTFFPHYARVYEPSSVLSFSFEEISQFLDHENEVVKRLFKDQKAIS